MKRRRGRPRLSGAPNKDVAPISQPWHGDIEEAFSKRRGKRPYTAMLMSHGFRLMIREKVQRFRNAIIFSSNEEQEMELLINAMVGLFKRYRHKKINALYLDDQIEIVREGRKLRFQT